MLLLCYPCVCGEKFCSFSYYRKVDVLSLCMRGKVIELSNKKDSEKFHYFLINELCKLLSDSNASTTIETNYTDITVWMDIIAKYCNVNGIEIERTISIEVLENGGTYGNEDVEEDEDYIDSDDDDEVIDF